MPRVLGRTKDHRSHLLKNLAVSLVQRGRLVTTEAKAKELRPYVARWVTVAKRAQAARGADRLAHERRLYQLVGSRAIVRTLVDEIAVRAAKRAGGYTRIIKLGARVGDGAPKALIEFVDQAASSDKTPAKQPSTQKDKA